MQPVDRTVARSTSSAGAEASCTGCPSSVARGAARAAGARRALSVPAAGLEAAVDESLAAGAKAIVAIAAGVGEEREQAIVARVRAAGAVLLGPNCLGVFDAAGELDLASNPLPSGPIGFVSQSGNIALETGLLLADVGLGFSRLASIGNQADLDATDVLRDLAAHDGTKAIGVYCEDFRDGRAFAEAARTAGKPVVLLTVGQTAASTRAARSHTGALTSSLDAVDAACRAAGVHRVETPRRLVETLQALLAAERPRGRRVAVVGDGGGYGAVACDLLGAHDLELPVLSRRAFRTRFARRCRRRRRRRIRSTSRARASRTRSASRGRRARCSSRATSTRPLHGVLRRLQLAVGRAARSRACRRGRARRGGARERRAARRAHDVLGCAAGAGAPRSGDRGVSRDRVGGRCGRDARRRRTSVVARSRR